jgi:hypothetical protein
MNKEFDILLGVLQEKIDGCPGVKPEYQAIVAAVEAWPANTPISAEMYARLKAVDAACSTGASSLLWVGAGALFVWFWLQ